MTINEQMREGAIRLAQGCGTEWVHLVAIIEMAMYEGANIQLRDMQTIRLDDGPREYSKGGNTMKSYSVRPSDCTRPEPCLLCPLMVAGKCPYAQVGGCATQCD